MLGLALAKPKHPSHVWSRKQSQGGRRAFGETVWQQNPNSRRYFWESSYRVKAADSALGAKSQIKVADVVLGLGDISVPRSGHGHTVRRGWSTFPRFCVEGAFLDCQKRGSRTENRNVECAGRKKIRIFYKVFNVTIFPSRSGFLAIYFGMCVFLGFWQIRA